MKNIIYTLILSSCFYVASAQVSGILYYKKTIDDKQTLTPRVENYMTYFSNQKSIETVRPAEVNETTVQSGENSVVKTIALKGGKRRPFVYKNLQNNELKLADYIDFKVYLIEDTLANMKWTISNETKRILKYNCIKATTNFRGRSYTAWFTEQIPVQNGPWKFGGLPGLIVKISDDENIFIYELEGINLKAKFDDKIITVPEIYANDMPLTQKAFIELYYKKVKELEMQSKASVFVKGNISGSSKSSVPPKLEKF